LQDADNSRGSTSRSCHIVLVVDTSRVSSRRGAGRTDVLGAIVLFSTESVHNAFALAKQESEHYLRLNPAFQRVGEWTAFEIHGDTDLSGAEMWSAMSRSEVGPTDYYPGLLPSLRTAARWRR
jgi:hypothetical protein